MSLWLGRQRKPDLLAMAERAGLEDVSPDLLKDEIVALLDHHLDKNATRLKGDDTFKSYYGRTSSPVKRDSAGSAAVAVTSDAEPKPRKRRVAKVKSEDAEVSEGPSPSSPIPEVIISTPAASRSLASPRSAHSATHAHISTFPPSPAVVTDVIETQTRRFSAAANDMIIATHAESTFVLVRELCSSVVGVETLILLFEGFAIHRRMIPWRYAFDIPGSQVAGTSSIAVFLPDFFVLLTDVYWSTTSLWAITNFWLPLAASWFFNLTIRPVVRHGVTTTRPRMQFDPLTFNIAKALLAWLVFSQGARFFGLFSDETVDLVTQAMPCGYAGVLIGAFIGMLVSLYDAAQRK